MNGFALLRLGCARRAVCYGDLVFRLRHRLECRLDFHVRLAHHKAGIGVGRFGNAHAAAHNDPCVERIALRRSVGGNMNGFALLHLGCARRTVYYGDLICRLFHRLIGRPDLHVCPAHHKAGIGVGWFGNGHAAGINDPLVKNLTLLRGVGGDIDGRAFLCLDRVCRSVRYRNLVLGLHIFRGPHLHGIGEGGDGIVRVA